MQEVVFYIFALICVIASLFVVLSRNPIHSVMWLILSFFCIGAIYILMHAHFIGIIQILVYAGAVMVLFIFVVMLFNLPMEILEARQKTIGKLLGSILTLSLICIISLFFITKFKVKTFSPDTNVGTIEYISKALFTDYIVPFEIASILLLVAIIGTVIMIKK